MKNKQSFSNEVKKEKKYISNGWKYSSPQKKKEVQLKDCGILLERSAYTLVFLSWHKMSHLSLTKKAQSKREHTITKLFVLGSL
jgi:hypothetical protein